MDRKRCFYNHIDQKEEGQESSLFLRIGRCVFDDLLQLLLEFHPGHQHAGTTAQAFDADVRPHADDAPLLGFMTGMLLLHFDDIVEIVVWISMLSASFVFFVRRQGIAQQHGDRHRPDSAGYR